MSLQKIEEKLNIKEKIQYSTAIGFLITGVIMCFLSFLLNEYDIKSGVLFYLGTAVTFTGAVFGINYMIENSVIKAETRINKKIEHKINQLESTGHTEEELEEEL